MTGVPEPLRAALSDRYQFEGELGAGGMGTVYEALDLKHNRVVAIKVLRPEVASTVGAGRFLREIEIVAGLTHPHIVPLHDSGEAGGFLFYVMPNIQGASLKDRLKSEGPLAIEAALAIARDVADGLAHAHERGFVHRDVKPGNILLSGKHGLIADFGVARAAEAADDGFTTGTGLVIGTPSYMSPEQFSDGPGVDPRSDVYSLGCVLYEMLSGEAPFTGRSAAAVFAGHVRGTATSLREVRPDVPPNVEALVSRMLAKDPDERFRTASEVFDALDHLNDDRRQTGLSIRAVGLVATVAAVAVIAGQAIFPQGAPLTISGTPESVVVVPLRDASSDATEQALLIDLADEVTRQLNRWESVRAVPQMALAGPSFDLGLSRGPLERVDDGLRIAEQTGVRTLVALTGRVRGDTAIVTATQFDVRSGRRLGSPVESVGPAGDRFRLGAAVVHTLLGLDGDVDDIEELRLQSASPEALRQQAEGRTHLESWRLSEAEVAFRASLVADSTFAMAHHYLALTLYWQADRDRTRLRPLVPEIGQASLNANRYSGGLPASDSVHIHAFYRFQEGDYEDARRAYNALVEQDPTDVYALLLLGIVEFHDPWLQPNAEGVLAPRQDLNRALAAFGEAVRLSPGFHLGYGHLFDITGRVLATAERGTGFGFERPRSNDAMPPWAATTPFDQLAFYAAYTDSLVWLSSAERDDWVSGDALQDGADRLLRSSMRTLRRWADFSPAEARPLDELVAWTLRERDRLTVPASPAVLDSLAVAASAYASRSLGLRSDSSASELVQLANLRLAVGDVAGSAELIDRAQRVLEDAPSTQRQHRSAANVRLFRGQPSRALSQLSRESPRRVYYEVPETGGLVEDAGAEPTIDELTFLASTGVGGSRLTEVFGRLNGLWSTDRYTDTELRNMRTVSSRRLVVALDATPTVSRAWLEGIERVDPIWDVVSAEATTETESLALMDAAETYSGERRISETARAYVLGSFALERGLSLLAGRYFARIDSIPESVLYRDSDWGLRGLAMYWRAVAYDSAGDTARAAPLYERFVAAWSDADELVPPLTEEAQAALRRIRR